MRRLALCLVLVVAGCKGAAPRPLPAASWARGTALWIHTDPNHNWADMPERSRPYAESDLRSAGFEIANRPGAFEVLLKSDGDDALDLVVLRDEKPIDTIRTAYNDWACHKFPATNLSIECTGREIASHLIDSPALAKAAREQQPAAAAPRPSTAKSLSGKLAVLELRNFAQELTRENVQYFTDMVRTAALKTQPQLEVMTRENLVVLLQATGKELSQCEGECEVDTGRRIGADEIVSGEIQKVGTQFKLSLRLHETHAGRLVASSQASGHSVDELDASAQQAVLELLK